MRYFNYFPKVRYDFTTNEKTPQIFTIPDVTARVQYLLDDVDFEAVLAPYYIRDTETPYSISLKLYDTADFYWTIPYVNGIYDMFGEWPLGEDEVVDVAKNKFPGYSKSRIAGYSFHVEVEPYGVGVTELVINKVSIDFIAPTMYERISIGTYLPETICDSGAAYVTNIVDSPSQITITISEITTSENIQRSYQKFTLSVLDYLNVDHFETISGAWKDQDAFKDDEQQVAITKLDNLVRENEDRRLIYVLKKEFVERFVIGYLRKMII